MDEKISDLDVLAGTDLADDDLLVVVDVSDPTMAASGTDKATSYSEIRDAIRAALDGDAITSGTVADARIAGTIARDAEVTAAVAIEATARDAAIATAVSAIDGAAITTGTVADARIASTIARDSEVTSAVAAEATARDTAIGVEATARTSAITAALLALDGGNVVTGTVADARIASTIARDSEVTAAILAEANARDAAITAQINALIAGAPAALDTLLEISNQFTTDEGVVAALTTTVGGKLAKASNLSDLTNAGTARTNLALGNVDNTADSAKPVSTAVQTALDLKANLNAPSFTGAVAMAAGLTLGGSLTTVGGTSLGGSFESRSGTFGLTFIATEYNGTVATYDARNTRGASNGVFSKSLSGDGLFCLRGGGSTDTSFADCGKILWSATQDFATGANGSKCGIYTVPNNQSTLTLGLLVDQDGSVTVTNSLTIGGALMTPLVGISAGGVVSGVTGYTQGSFAAATAMFLRRANGSSGSESQVLSTQTFGSLNFQGWNNTNGGYLTSASITATADQDFTTTGFRGSSLKFNTAPSSVNGGALVRLIIDNAGKVYFGSSTAATTSIDQSGNTAIGGTLAVVGNVGFNGKSAQALTGWSAPTATALRTAAPNATYSTTGATGTTAGAFDTNTHRDNIITDLASTMRRLATLEADLIANGVIG